MFLKLDGTFFVQLINFAVFFAILRVVFIRPVGAAIARRRQYINSVINDYDRYQAEASFLRTQAEAIRAAARREAEAALAKARSEAASEAAALTTRYNDEVSRLVEDANRTVAEEMQKARSSEPHLVRELAVTMVDRTLAESTR